MLKTKHKRLILFLTASLMLSGVYFLFLSRSSIFPPPSPCAEMDSCPNIVLVILDDMPWDHFGFLSSPVTHTHVFTQTPHIDELAKQGFVFRNAYNTNSRCRASLATYLTGQLPHQNLIYANQGVLKLHDDKALPRVLREAGYATFAGGKMWEGNPEQLKLTDYDLDTFHFVRTSQQKLENFLQQYAGKQPVFVWWAPLLPHRTHNPPQRYFDAIDPATIVIPDVVAPEDRAEYRKLEHAFLATVAWTDDEIGRLKDLLRQNGIEKNTWMILLSDNGWSNAYTAKGSPYDIGVKTPWIVWGPEVQSGHTDQLISTQNLYGSILQLAGLSADADRSAAHNIFSIARGESTPDFKDEAVYWASYPGYTGKSEPHPRAERDVYALSLRHQNWQYTFYVKSDGETGSLEDKAPAVIHMGMSGDYRFQAGDEKLFDLNEDPFSQNNLQGQSQHQERLRAFRRDVIDEWQRSGGRPLDSFLACQKTSDSALCRKYLEIQ